MRLMGLENNKAAHHIRVCGDAATAPNITHIGWSRNTVGKLKFNNQKTPTQPWQKLMSEELELQGSPAPLDLPRELTFLEVDSALPKISPLPSSSAGAGCVFSIHFLDHSLNMTAARMVWSSRYGQASNIFSSPSTPRTATKSL